MTGSLPDVSVVIATRNRRELLHEALASVRSQTGVAVEIIVVDDASADDTLASLQGMTELRVIGLPVKGERSAARNQGMMEATGHHLMFLDDDDRLLPGALQTLVSALSRYPRAVAAIGARRDWFVEEHYRRRDVHPRWKRARHIGDELLFGWSAVSGQNLYRTDVVKSLGGFSERYTYVEDRDLWLRVAACGPVVLCPETVMEYRIAATQQRPTNIRQLRERVATDAIARLPESMRHRARRIRRATALVDSAEESVHTGAAWRSVPLMLRAIVLAPRVLLTPLIGCWVARRLLGRAARRWLPR